MAMDYDPATMAPKDHTIGVRVSDEMLEAIEAYRASLEAATGLDVKTAAAARRLIELGLASLAKPSRR